MRRLILGHAMMLTLRGVPTVYAGDEQGFVGHGGDQPAREDQFASRTPEYLDDRLLGVRTGHEVAHYDSDHPIYRAIAALAKVRAATPALRRGRQVVRAVSETPGLLAVSRFDPDTGREVLIAFNTSLVAVAAPVEVETASQAWTALRGTCAPQSAAPGSVKVAIPPLDAIVCAAQ